MAGPNFTTPVRILDGRKTVIELNPGGELIIDGGGGDATGVRVGADAKGSYLVLRAGDATRARILASAADLFLGGNGAAGNIVLHPNGAANEAGFEQSSIHLDANSSRITMRSGGQRTVTVDGKGGDLFLGGNGAAGNIVLHPNGVANEAGFEQSSIHLDANSSRITMRSGGQPTLTVDGEAGDIVLANADGAEEFEVDDDTEIGPGAVLVVGEHDRLRLADEPYDRCVAGVVSGAGDLRPGIVLGRVPGGRRMPVALFGRVHCRVDATYGPVTPGDLLTTSPTPGHAMRAEAGQRALGAVLGKALRGVSAGTGLVPVLVALQ